MKFLREIKRLIKQLFFLPFNILGYLFSTYFYDFFLSNKKKIYPGNISSETKILIYVIFPTDGLNQFHFRTLNYFLNRGYSPIVVSNMKLKKEDQEKIKNKSSYFIERENYGYDFGGWRDGIIFLKDQLPVLENLVLMNDSTWFPVTKGNDFVDFIQKSNLDFIGATSHYGLERSKIPRIKEKLKTKFKFNLKSKNFHYASYALSFSNKILKDENFLKFWKKLRLSNTYNVIVRNCEIGISQWVIKNGIYTHGSLVDSSEISEVLNKQSKEKLHDVIQNLIVNSIPLKTFLNKFSKSIETFSKKELISLIMTVISRQIIVFSLIDFLIKELDFPFLKKRLFNLDKGSSEKVMELVKSLEAPIKEDILSEIGTSSSLKKFLRF
tara:strand:- start:2715 stop:3860 length:1146 start_codon:yes stop_codon:yes gene_type:complete